jgi:hypothetical protein
MKAIQLDLEYGRGGLELIFSKFIEVDDLGEHAFQHLQSTIAEKESSADCEYCCIEEVNSGIAVVMTGEDTSTYFITEESPLYPEIEEYELDTSECLRTDGSFIEFYENFDEKVWQLVANTETKGDL